MKHNVTFTLLIEPLPLKYLLPSFIFCCSNFFALLPSSFFVRVYYLQRISIIIFLFSTINGKKSVVYAEKKTRQPTITGHFFLTYIFDLLYVTVTTKFSFFTLVVLLLVV